MEKVDRLYTKYDIMSKKIKSLITIILKSQYLVIKTSLISKEKEKEVLQCIGLNYALKNLDVLANIFYEIYLDICGMSQNDFDKCLQEGIFNMSDLGFVFDLNSFAKVLLFNAITINENGNLCDRVLKKMKEEKIDMNEAYYIVISELTPEQKSYLKLLKNPNFEYHKLDEEGLNILKSYHQEFMDKAITPYVNKTLDVKQSVEQSFKILKRIPSINVNIDLPLERYNYFYKNL